jgi:hypothetical protein
MENKINLIIGLVILLVAVIAVSVGIILPAFMSSAWISFGWMFVIIAFYVALLIMASIYLAMKIIKKIKELLVIYD